MMLAPSNNLQLVIRPVLIQGLRRLLWFPKSFLTPIFRVIFQNLSSRKKFSFTPQNLSFGSNWNLYLHLKIGTFFLQNQHRRTRSNVLFSSEDTLYPFFSPHFKSYSRTALCTRFFLYLQTVVRIQPCKNCVKLIFSVLLACAWRCWHVDASSLSSQQFNACPVLMHQSKHLSVAVELCFLALQSMDCRVIVSAVLQHVEWSKADLVSVASTSCWCWDWLQMFSALKVSLSFSNCFGARLFPVYTFVAHSAEVSRNFFSSSSVSSSCSYSYHWIVYRRLRLWPMWPTLASQLTSLAGLLYWLYHLTLDFFTDVAYLSSSAINRSVEHVRAPMLGASSRD